MSETRKARGGRIMRARVSEALNERARAAEQEVITGLRAWAQPVSFFGVDRGVQSMQFGRLGALVFEVGDE